MIGEFIRFTLKCKHLKKCINNRNIMKKNSREKKLPATGKKQIDLQALGFSINPKKDKLTLFIPCSAQKPYKKSNTHKYIHAKLKQNIPNIWLKQIKICTVSEVLGIVPEELEDKIFYQLGYDYNY